MEVPRICVGLVREAHVEVSVLAQKLCQAVADIVGDVLLPQTVSLGACVRILRIMSLIYKNADSQSIQLLSVYYIIFPCGAKLPRTFS